MEPRKLSELRSMAIQKPSNSSNSNNEANNSKKVAELESRVRNLEFLVNQMSSSSSSREAHVSAPPSYNTPLIKGPSRPLF